jgi:hypothetical protein
MGSRIALIAARGFVTVVVNHYFERRKARFHDQYNGLSRLLSP